MNLHSASNHHRNIVIAFAMLMAFAAFIDLGDGNDPSLFAIAIIAAFFIFEFASFVLLANSLNKNKLVWAAITLASPFLIFVPLLFLIVSANRVFKSNGWKVKFYGGASPVAA